MRGKSGVSIVVVGVLAALATSCSSSSSGGGAGNPVVRPPAQPAVTAKGDPNGAPMQATIGATGGQLTSSDGVLTIVVPAGALAADTMLGIQPITSLAPGALGAGYRLTPEGQIFATPAQLVFKHTDAQLAGSAVEALHVGYQDDQGQWRSIKSVARDAGAHTVTVTTTHFSDWSQTDGLKVTPGSKTIKPGETVNLRLDDCERKEDAASNLADLMLTCQQVGTSAIWSANGAPGGDSASGTVTEVDPGDATYVAPDVTPPGNPVAVSANVAQADGSKILVVSNITVGGHPTFAGTSTVDTTIDGGGGLLTKTMVSATVRWTWSDEDQTYHAAGTLTVDYDYTGPNCKTTAHADGTIAARDGTLAIFDTGGGGPMQYSGNGFTQVAVNGTSTCNDTHTPEPAMVSTGPTFWWQPPPMPASVSADGRTIEGMMTSPPGQIPSTNAHWSFIQE